MSLESNSGIELAVFAEDLDKALLSPTLQVEELTLDPIYPITEWKGISTYLENEALVQSHGTKLEKTRAGWKVGAYWAAGAAIFCLSTNVIFAILIGIHGEAAGTHSVVTRLFNRDCGRVTRINTFLHWVINVLSTVLLSGSSYCMQCLSAPTRSDIDQAHAKGKWLDVGVLSTRNLRRLPCIRVTWWWLLACSSLPLHLLY